MIKINLNLVKILLYLVILEFLDLPLLQNHLNLWKKHNKKKINYKHLKL